MTHALMCKHYINADDISTHDSDMDLQDLGLMGLYDIELTLRLDPMSMLGHREAKSSD